MSLLVFRTLALVSLAAGTLPPPEADAPPTLIIKEGQIKTTYAGPERCEASPGFDAETLECLRVDCELQWIKARAKTGGKNPWPRLRDLFRRLPAGCDGGEMAEGFSDFVVWSLARQWEHVSSLAQVVDPAFHAWVLEHVDATADEDELKAAGDNAASRCPAGVEALCVRLREAVARAVKDLGARSQ